MTKKWIVKAHTPERPGKLIWVAIKEFDNPADADEWLASYIRTNGYSNSDFTIQRVEK